MDQTVQLGQTVPNFSAQTTTGEINLKQYSGQYLVLYFYPKDNTPGCTTESQDFRDTYNNFKQLNTEIIGISRDSLKSHENFISKQNLPFNLISDENEELCQLFDVIKLKNMFGKQRLGIERSTFIIGPDGTLLTEWRKVKVAEHVQEVLNKIKELQA